MSFSTLLGSAAVLPRFLQGARGVDIKSLDSKHLCVKRSGSLSRAALRARNSVQRSSIVDCALVEPAQSETVCISLEFADDST